MSASSVTHPKLLPTCNQTAVRQILEVAINNNLSFATIFMREDSPGGQAKFPCHLIGYNTNWGVVFWKIYYHLSLENKKQKEELQRQTNFPTWQKSMGEIIVELIGATHNNRIKV